MYKKHPKELPLAFKEWTEADSWFEEHFPDGYEVLDQDVITCHWEGILNSANGEAVEMESFALLSDGYCGDSLEVTLWCFNDNRKPVDPPKHRIALLNFPGHAFGRFAMLIGTPGDREVFVKSASEEIEDFETAISSLANYKG